MTEEEFQRLFVTMPFNTGPIKKVSKIAENTLYIHMFNEADLIFIFNNMGDWSLRTAENVCKELDAQGGDK